MVLQLQRGSTFGSESAEKIMVDIITFPMNVIGLNPFADDGRRFLRRKARVFICNFILGYGMYSTLLFSYHSFGDFYSFVVPVSYFVCLLLVFVNVVWLHRRNDEIRYLLTEIGENIYKYPDESSSSSPYFRHHIYDGWIGQSKYVKLRNLILLLEIVGFVFAGTSPLVGYVFVGEMRTFIYPGWISWTVDTPLKYIGTYCLQATVASTVFWVYYTTQIYITFVLVEFLRQFRKLDEALITLHKRTIEAVLPTTFEQGKTIERPVPASARFQNERYVPFVSSTVNGVNLLETSYRRAYDHTYRQNLILCVKHHQKLTALFRIFKHWYVQFYSMELAISVLSFSLLFYCLVEANDYERYSSIFGVTALLVSSVFTRCYVGEKFAELNDGLSRSIFHLMNWYDQIPENKRLLFLLHLFTTRPLILSGFGLFKASYNTFTAITRISYSNYGARLKCFHIRPRWDDFYSDINKIHRPETAIVKKFYRYHQISQNVFLQKINT